MTRSRSIIPVLSAVMLAALACNVLSSPANNPTPGAPLSATSGPGTQPAPKASPTSSGRSAILNELLRAVDARNTEATDWATAALGEQILTGGGVRTGDTARARVDISDGTIVRLAATTIFTLTTISPGETDPVTKFILDAGKVWVYVTKQLGAGSFEIDTPSGVSAVRGSLMSVEYSPASGRTAVTCLEGQCRLTGQSGRFTDLTAGEQTEIPGLGQDPTPAQTIDADQLADWAGEFPEAGEVVAKTTPGPRPALTATVPSGVGAVVTGFWTETYGQTKVTGKCIEAAGGDGGGQGDANKPVTPIRLLADGNALLVSARNNRYDRTSPGVYAVERTYDLPTIDVKLKPITVTVTSRDELHVLSPTQIEWQNSFSEKGGCTINFTKTLDLAWGDPNVLAEDRPGLPPLRGDYTVTWHADQCAYPELAQEVPTFTQIAVTPGYEGSFVMYGLGLYQRIKPTESGSYAYTEKKPSGVQFILNIDVGDPRTFYPFWSLVSANGSQACSGVAEMKLIRKPQP